MLELASQRIPHVERIDHALPVRGHLREVDVDETTPRPALELLADLKKLAE